MIDRESELLPVPYYHMVFTLPHCFNALLPKHAKAIYSSLFKATWLTLQAFANEDKYLGAKIAKEKLGINPAQCPFCNQETMMVIKIIDPEGGLPNTKFPHV